MNAKALSLNCPVQVEGGRKASEKEQWGAQSSQGPHLLAPLSGSRWRKGESQQNRENKAHTLLYCRSAAKALPELPVPWKSWHTRQEAEPKQWVDTTGAVPRRWWGPAPRETVDRPGGTEGGRLSRAGGASRARTTPALHWSRTARPWPRSQLGKEIASSTRRCGVIRRFACRPFVSQSFSDPDAWVLSWMSESCSRRFLCIWEND